MVTKFQVADVIKKQEGKRAAQPLLYVIYKFLLALIILNLDNYLCGSILCGLSIRPYGQRKLPFVKCHYKSGAAKYYCISQAEGAFKADAAKPNGSEQSFVGITKATQGCKVFIGKILAIMDEGKYSIFNSDRDFCRLGIIGVLQQLRQNMPWTLHLFEKLMPGCG
ncbi:MAG TPA: hypothetical protein PLN86_04165 [Candidatus Hydrogenedentes bacterium]|nr:hypothetical protein [Candidatus Hydrogenedentota bacterium]